MRLEAKVAEAEAEFIKVEQYMDQVDQRNEISALTAQLAELMSARDRERENITQVAKLRPVSPLRKSSQLVH